MYVDGQMDFANQQALSSATTTISTNVYDAGAAKKLFAGASGKGTVFVTVAPTDPTSLGTDRTIRVQFVASASATITSSPEILADSGILPTMDVVGYPLAVELKPSEQKSAFRYYGVLWISAGTGVAFLCNAQYVETAQSNLIK